MDELISTEILLDKRFTISSITIFLLGVPYVLLVSLLNIICVSVIRRIRDGGTDMITHILQNISNPKITWNHARVTLHDWQQKANKFDKMAQTQHTR